MAEQARTTWASAWIEPLLQKTSDETLAQGRKYFNAGNVLESQRTNNITMMTVYGSYGSYYSIKITFPKITEPQSKIIKKMISKSPTILSAFICGQFLHELSDRLLDEQIKIFPTSPDDIYISCTCYTKELFCRHAVAAIYSLSVAIDADPRMLFTLRGCNLGELVGDLSDENLGQFKKIVSFKELFKKHKQKKIASDAFALESINFTQIPNLQHQIYDMLQDNPIFFDKNFRDILQACYKYWQKNPIGKNNLNTYVKASEVDLTPEEQFIIAWPTIETWNSFQIIIDDKNKLKEILADQKNLFEYQSQLPNRLVDFLQTIPYGLVHKLNYQLRYMHLVLQFAQKLIEKSGLIPQIITGKRNEVFIRWLPALFNEEINTIYNKLVQACPENLVMYGKINISPEQQVQALLACIFAVRMENNIPAVADKYKPILYLFFKQKSYSFNNHSMNNIPSLIHQWLSNLYLYSRPYQFYFVIKQKDEGFNVQLKISLNTGQAPIALSSILKQELPVKTMILFDMYKIAQYTPSTNPAVCSGKAVFFNIQDFVPLFLKVLPILKSMGIIVALPRSLRQTLQPTLSLDLHYKKESLGATSFLQLDQILSFDWKVAIGDKKMSVTEFNKLVKNAGGFIKIMEEYIILDEDKMKALIGQIKKMPDTLENADLMQAVLAGQFDDAIVCIDDQIKNMFDQLKNYDPIAIPHNLQATLRPYQERGFHWMMQNITTGFGSILADDMGLGKTLQVIAVVLHLKNQGMLASQKVLIVAPTGLLSNWKKEIERFAPELQLHVYHGPTRSLATKDLYDVIITSYGHARSDQKELSESRWFLLVIDEAQNIKNPLTDQTKALKSIPSNYKIALSGTPVENRLLEYWSIFDFTNKHYLGNAKLFQDRFVVPIERDRNKNALEVFKKITSPFILRRLKNDKHIIQDLPDKIENNRYCSLTPEQTALYQEVVKTSLKKIELAEGMARRGLILSLINSLKQICNHPSQFSKQKIATLEQSDKMQTLQEILRDIDDLGEKTLIFTQYVEMGMIISDLVSAEFKTKVPFLHGGLTRAKRDEIIHDFQNHSQDRILIISLKAGGTGLNLTCANHVIHYDLWWNPAVENQATDRAYRIGQKSNVMVHRLIVAGTFEERIDEMIQSKKELANMTIGSGESWITEMSSQQLKDLVNLRKDV